VAEEKIEDETYSLIYTSLKHPVRRRILRMLAQKPLSYSEILEALTIDSGHLSYHLESLGELISHTKDGKYTLSSFGVAALRLMNGVEELPPQTPTKKRRIAKFIPKVLSLLLAISLVVTSIHFVTYTTPVSISILNENYQIPSIFTIDDTKGIFEIDIIVDQINDTNSAGSNVPWIPTHRGAAYTFAIEPTPDSLTTQTRGLLWLNVGLICVGDIPRSNGILLYQVPSRPCFNGAPSSILVDAYMPTEDKSLGPLQRANNDSNLLTSPAVEVNQLGTYRFVLWTNSSSKWAAGYMAYITPILQWQITEKPYITYGILGFVISTGYIALVSYNALKPKNKNHVLTKAV